MKFLTLLFLLCASAFGATGDWVSGTVQTNGWDMQIAWSGLATNKTLSFGWNTNNTITGSDMVKLTVTSPGYDSTGATNVQTRTVYGTKQLRYAYSELGQTTDSNFEKTSISGGNLLCDIALSEPLFVGDSATADVQASLYDAAGTPNNASTGQSVVNNSTDTYDAVKCHGQWDCIAGVRAADRVSADFPVAFNADHHFGVACVIFTATGLTSSHVETVTVSTETTTRRTGSGLYLSSYVATIPVAGFTSGESIALRARVYPNVGNAGSVLDTDNFTTAIEEARGFNKPTIVYNTTVTYAYVDVVSGNNATGVASTTYATAVASPFQHIGKAVQAGATRIRLKNSQTHPLVGTSPSSRRTTSEWVVIEPEPGHDATDTTVQVTTTQSYKCQREQFSNVKVTLLSTASWVAGDGAGNYIRFTGCNFDSTGVGKPSASMAYQSDGCYLENCTGDLSNTEWHLPSLGVEKHAMQFDGCDMTDTTSGAAGIDGWYRVTACSMHGDVNWTEKIDANPCPTQEGAWFCNNTVTGDHGGIIWFEFGKLTNVYNRGIVFNGNEAEIITTGNPIVWIAADGCRVDFDNLIARRNTTAGNRWNFGYNDGTASSGAGNAYWRRNWSVQNNIWDSMATKHDTFTGTSANGARIGGWAVLYGVGFNGNLSAHTTGIGVSGSFCHEFIGINSYQPALNGNQPPGCTPNSVGWIKFFDLEAYNGSSGVGGGNYGVFPVSPATRLGPTPRTRLYDLHGKGYALHPAAGAKAFVHPSQF